MIDEFSGVSPQVVDVLSVIVAVIVAVLWAWVVRTLGRAERIAR